MFTPKVFPTKSFIATKSCIQTARLRFFAVAKRSMITAGVLVFSISPAWQAQVLKGGQQQPSVGGNQPAETPEQFHARLARTIQVSRKMSPKIVSPQGQQQLTINGIRNSSDIGVLRTQKLNADREVQSLALTINGKSGPQGAAATGAANPGSASYPGGPASYPGGPATPKTANGAQKNQNSSLPAVMKTNSTLPAVMKSDSKTATGPGGGPGLQGPMKTESATGSSAPGSTAPSTMALLHCQPTISTISGFPTVTFSPIAMFNPYTIKGCGFGNRMGAVYLTGGFFTGRINLTVQTSGGDNRKAPAHAGWSDTAIVVSVDPRLSGELNQDNVTLVVEPVGGSPIQKAGNRFLAFHEDVMLQPIPQSAVTLFRLVTTATGGKKTASLSGGSDVTTGGLAQTGDPFPFYNSPAGTASASVFREDGGTRALSFFPAGSDLFDLSGLSPAFVGEYFQLYTDAVPAGCDVSGSWNARWEGNKVRVTWQEIMCGSGMFSSVWSEYALGVVVNGPRGIDPWTGRRLLTAAPARSLAR